MDISLAVLAHSAEKESGERNKDPHTLSLKWAGANNPLWILRKGADDIEEIRADKQPVGRFVAEVPFTSHSVELHKGDTLYLYTDGYPDQFGKIHARCI
jgi:serine phosphatase RsbU (regulator of sigma subunit)